MRGAFFTRSWVPSQVPTGKDLAQNLENLELASLVISLSF